jgi:hypothetical protein
MSFEILQAFFGFGQQLIESGRSCPTPAAVDPFSIGFAQALIHSPVHDPQVPGAKLGAYVASVRLVQTVMQALPICQVHMLF